MPREEKFHIIIAETSPIISAGFSQCLRRIPSFPANILEVKSPDALADCVRASVPDLLIVNPTFGGLFNPGQWKADSNCPDVKIIAIELGKLSRQAAALYDDVISVIDDIDSISDKIKRLCISSQDSPDEKETLSIREKEIISWVVRGLTNQEIADKLFLSIHTVITHRRNIARKLEIHSATGLTIYAIVNKIVDISDIKL